MQQMATNKKAVEMRAFVCGRKWVLYTGLRERNTLQKTFSGQMVHTLVDWLSLSMIGVLAKPSRQTHSEILEEPGFEELFAGQLFLIPVQHHDPALHKTQGLLFTP
jgi:hypothetical protein